MQQTYQEAAESAAMLERAGSYGEAAIYWQRASSLAKKEINCKWALNRSQFCNRMKTRPFKGA
ncbi:ANR family transcriptional regulator [Gallibacterium genomosp. 1]|uniref:ANR family transcriptional regulator n=1 Tax=Gallibacterium genomosp. 1 TaxID=155515 RepID=A0A0A2Y025_9PAST|nr:ANR family transcriptional regulator [Gallibacterium genomosp. 1]KGQ36472.1 hypothetical protein JP36_10085 [Gallibacterium genomosp. 1]